jgi:multicomponent Na+:H+ antiporter subunit E
MAGQFVALFAFWQVLSWRLDPLYVATGLVVAAVVTVVTQPLTATIVHADRPSPPLRRLPLLMWRFACYVVWLLGRMVVAGVQIGRLALDPKLPIDPVELRFRTELASPMARTVFTNSITLVPGTLCVDLDGEWVLVHALFPSAADDLLSGALQNRVAAMFDEPEQPPAVATWLPLPTARPGDTDPTDSTLQPHAAEPVALGWGWEADDDLDATIATNGDTGADTGADSGPDTGPDSGEPTS